MSTRFGLIVFPQSRNSGDAIQSIAAMRHLPRVDVLLDREALHAYRARDGLKARTIGNGWFIHNVDNWPPSEDIDLLPISMHFGPDSAPHVFSGRNLDYWLSRPYRIGARDLYTFGTMKAAGLNCYFSACLTLTLEPKVKTGERKRVIICDVSDEVEEFVRATSPLPVDKVTHSESNDEAIDAKLLRGEQLLAGYASAHCVVTSRLHAALPSLAMGTPVFLITEGAWEGEYRFPGLSDLVWSGRAKAVLEKTYDFITPPPNPTKHLALRHNLVRTVEQFVTAGGNADRKETAGSAASARGPGIDRDPDGVFAGAVVGRQGSGDPVKFGTTAEGESGMADASPAAGFAERTRPEAVLTAEIARLQGQLDLVSRELATTRRRADEDMRANVRLEAEIAVLRDRNSANSATLDELKNLQFAALESRYRIELKDARIRELESARDAVTALESVRIDAKDTRIRELETALQRLSVESSERDVALEELAGPAPDRQTNLSPLERLRKRMETLIARIEELDSDSNEKLATARLDILRARQRSAASAQENLILRDSVWRLQNRVAALETESAAKDETSANLVMMASELVQRVDQSAGTEATVASLIGAGRPPNPDSTQLVEWMSSLNTALWQIWQRKLSEFDEVQLEKESIAAELDAAHLDRRQMATELEGLRFVQQNLSVPAPVARLYRGMRGVTPGPLRSLMRKLRPRRDPPPPAES